MTTRALVRAARFDINAARDSLRRRAAIQETVVDGRRVRLICEPLFKRSASGDLLQSLRVDVDDQPNALTTAVVRTPAGVPVACRGEPGPAGIRGLGPEGREPTTLHVLLPKLSNARANQVPPQ